MTKEQQAGNRFRRLILIAGILYCVAGVGWLILPYLNDILFGSDSDFLGAGLMGTPLLIYWEADDSPWGYAFCLVLVVGLILLAQWAFLRPMTAWWASPVATKRTVRSSIYAASAMAMLLTVGLIALILEFPDSWEPLLNHGIEGALTLWSGMLLLWALWAWVFFVYWRQGDTYTKLGRLIRGLVVGSLLETVVAVPAHVWATQQRQCYCARGTYTTLVLAGTVLLWAFGPGIIMLYYRERFRRHQLTPHCHECGYDLTGNESGVCPECGRAI